MIAAIDFAAGTDVGLKRQNNEDSYVVLAGSERNSFVVILADGMGGHQKGEVASSTAVQYVSAALARQINMNMDSVQMRKTVAEIVEKSNVKVYLQSLESKDHRGMGTTLTVAVINRDRMVIGHIGDCRSYVLRGDKLLQLTTDHTLVQVLVDRGDLSVEAARQHKRKNVVTRALGSRDYVKADIIDFQLQKGDKLLFCSDGLHDYVEENEFKKILKQEHNPRETVIKLIKLANDTAGMDNVTVIVGIVS